MKKVNYPLKRKIMNFSLLVLTFLSTQILAQLAAWNPNSLSGYGPSPWTATSTNASITVGGWTRGAGVGTSGSAAANAWGGNNWGGASNQDATFTITSNPGSVVSYSTFNLYYRRSTTGPSTGSLEYAFGSSSTTYTSINTFTFSSTSSTGALHSPISLSGVTALQNLAPGTVVKFRILPSASTSTAGTWYIFSSGASITGTIASFNVNISQTASISCNGQSTGALSATVFGSTAPYTYSWLPSGGTSSLATNLSAGVYTCFVTSASSETTSSTFTVSQPPVLTSTVSGQINVSCGGTSNGSATVSVGGGHPSYTYSWLPSGGTGSVATNMAAGNYTLNILDSNNCSRSQTITITQPASSLSVSVSSSVICPGATVTANATGANTYTWTNGIANGIPFVPSVSTIYTVSGTNTLTGCTDSNTLSILVNPTPTITAVSNFTAATVCKGSSIILNASGASSYTWSGSVIDGTPFSPTVTSTYSVTGTDANNCSGSTFITVTVNPLPTLTITTSKTMLCKGETSTLTAIGAFTYTWNTTATTSVIVISPTITTSYSLTGKDNNGCSNTSTVSQKVSGCTGIEDVTSAVVNSLLIFPNPNAGEFTVKYSSNIDLLVINELGSILQTISLNDENNREARVTNLNSGLYILVSTKNGAGIKQKVIVSK